MPPRISWIFMFQLLMALKLIFMVMSARSQDFKFTAMPDQDTVWLQQRFAFQFCIPIIIPKQLCFYSQHHRILCLLMA